jgi:hypothetical protein
LALSEISLISVRSFGIFRSGFTELFSKTSRRKAVQKSYKNTASFLQTIEIYKIKGS